MKHVSRSGALWALAAGAFGVSGLVGCDAGQSREQPQAFVAPRSAEADALIRRADEAAAKGDSDRAVALYREAIVIDRDRYVAWNNLGAELMEREDYLDAVAALKVASDLSPRDPRPVANIGMAYLEMGWAQDALEYFDQSLGRDPNFLDALRGYALAEDTLGQASLRSLERVKLGLMMEKDEKWRNFFERRRFRIESQLRQPGV